MRVASILLIVSCLLSVSDAAEIRVAAASSLHHLLTDVAKSFEVEHGHRVILIFGSSGNLVSQIRQGAPYDAFFSADMEYATQLESAGVTLPGSSIHYARGQLVLWTSKSSGLDPQQGLKRLVDSSSGKIAIANPDHAPYGEAAVEALKHYGIYDGLKDRLVFGENVLQASQFAESGSAIGGIIALSLAVTARMTQIGRYWQIPLEAYTPLTQTAVVLKSTKQPEVALQFLLYFERPEIRNRLPEFGFLSPPE